MNNIVQFPPSDYVDMLTTNFYQQDNNRYANVTTYMSANTRYGGANNANTLLQDLLKVTAGKPENAKLSSADFKRVFTGQGLYEDIYAAMSIVESFKDDLAKADKGLAKILAQPDFMQKMVDNAYFGVDCIGFIGTYLVAAGGQSKYEGRRPLDYLSVFQPVHSIGEIDDLCILTLTSGEHIQMIDEVTKRDKNAITCTISQSTSHGPQTNVGMRITAGGGNYLDVDKFRAAVTDKSYDAQWKADSAARVAKGSRARDYEGYLRSIMTEGGHAAGYHGGAIFQLTGPSPVTGSIYVGRLPNGMHVGTPPA